MIKNIISIKYIDKEDELIESIFNTSNYLIHSPIELVENLFLTFNIIFSIKADFEKDIWILSTDTTLDEDTTLKVFEYIYNKKCGLWSIEVNNFFDNMSFREYRNKKIKENV